MEVLAIIPARGGSKSIPRKNIVELGGKPLLAWVLGTVKASKLVSRALVSTEDAEIAAVAKKYGAEVPFMRPKELTEDATPGMPVIKHALEWLKEKEKYIPDYVLLVQPTSPFIKTSEIDAALELIQKNPQADSVTSVQEVPNHFHPINLRLLTDEGYLQFVDPAERAKYNTRQSKPKRYAIGNLWVFKPEVVYKKEIPIGDKCLPIVIKGLSVFDLDTPDDLEMARALLPLITRNN